MENTIETNAVGAPDVKPKKKLYPLDWADQAVNLAKGRFKITLRRPTDDELLEREKQLELDLPIGKDGSYQLPDPMVQEKIDAELATKLLISSEGYGDSEIPQAHLAAAFNGLYQSEFYIPDDADIFADEIQVIEEIGSGDEPDFTIVHTINAPDEKLLNLIRKKMGGGKIMPGRRGKSSFVQKSDLRAMMDFYEQLFERVEGGTVGEKVQEPHDQRELFITFVSPFAKREVVKQVVNALTGNLLD